MSLAAKYAWFLLVLLLVSNGFWIYDWSIRSIGALYAQEQACATARTARDAVALLPIAAQTGGRRHAMLEHAASKLGVSASIEAPDSVELGGVHLIFDHDGILSDAKPLSYATFSNCGPIPPSPESPNRSAGSGGR